MTTRKIPQRAMSVIVRYLMADTAINPNDLPTHDYMIETCAEIQESISRAILAYANEDFEAVWEYIADIRMNASIYDETEELYSRAISALESFTYPKFDDFMNSE